MEQAQGNANPAAAPDPPPPGAGRACANSACTFVEMGSALICGRCSGMTGGGVDHFADRILNEVIAVRAVSPLDLADIMPMIENGDTDNLIPFNLYWAIMDLRNQLSKVYKDVRNLTKPADNNLAITHIGDLVVRRAWETAGPQNPAQNPPQNP
ncbi:hypothetical protein MAPG_06380 [Magnaporthiopsis poae ATCC 64411]|uniref:Uncharacterized protein n=1 Tax=Magnaporthiopsis poae (strain ATCC 64411 / 73-15) TaxID=644358 RepID=A0A0C4E1V8_MAGP6|nr:hypothetical protein MAPG_06380 [Magnaporthiopsis poae ATCC 64411]